MSNEGSGEQPTSVESELLDLPTGDALPQGGQIRLRDMLRPEAVQMILKLISEERRQAKIAATEKILSMATDEVYDWMRMTSIDPSAVERYLTELKGENNE